MVASNEWLLTRLGAGFYESWYMYWLRDLGKRLVPLSFYVWKLSFKTNLFNCEADPLNHQLVGGLLYASQHNITINNLIDNLHFINTEFAHWLTVHWNQINQPKQIALHCFIPPPSNTSFHLLHLPLKKALDWYRYVCPIMYIGVEYEDQLALVRHDVVRPLWRGSLPSSTAQ